MRDRPARRAGRRARPRRPRRRTASARRAGGGRRGRRRRPEDPRGAGAPRASPRSRTRSSGARRAAARRRRRARRSPRPRRRRGPRAARPAPAPSRAARRACAAPGSRDALAPGRSYSASVPSSAASVSLSARSALWSGWRRSRSISSPRPTTMPACGPPRSLSPEKQTRSAPAARLAAAVGSSPTSSREPEPRSSTSGSPARFGDPRQLLRRDGGREPDDAVVRLVHAEQRGGLRTDRALVVLGSSSGSSSRPRSSARPSGRGPPGSGTRRRSRRAPRGTRRPRAPPRARRARAAPRPRCC